MNSSHRRALRPTLESLEDRLVMDGTAPTVTGVFTGPNTAWLGAGEYLQSPPAVLHVGFSHDLAISGTESVLDRANWSLTMNGADVSASIEEISFGSDTPGRWLATLTLAEPLTPGTYQLTVGQAVQSTDGVGLDGDSDGTAGGDYTLPFTVGASIRLGAQIRLGAAEASSHEVAVASLAGGFLVAWIGADDAGKATGVFAQRLDAQGMPRAPVFLVSADVKNSNAVPSIAVGPTGFVVAWTNSDGTGDESKVLARRYDLTGVAIGGPLQINSLTSSRHSAPVVAIGSDGGFVVAWQSGNAATGYTRWVRRYSPAGQALSGEKRNDLDSRAARSLRAAIRPGGEALLVWSSVETDPGSAEEVYAVHAQRYGAQGGALGDPILVSPEGLLQDPTPAVSAVAGGFVVAWTESTQEGEAEIVTQRYDADGQALGGVRANTTIAGVQSSPTVASSPDGRFLVAWQSAEQDGSGWGIYAQRFDAQGLPDGGEFRPNQLTAGDQTTPVVTFEGNEQFVVSWRGPLVDGSRDLLAQRFNSSVTAGVTGPAAAVPSQALTFTLTSASPASPADPVTYHIDWDGDGTTDQTVIGSSSMRVAHVFAAARSTRYSVRVTASTAGKTSAAATFAVAVVPIRFGPDPVLPGRNSLWVGGSAFADQITISPLSGLTATGQTVRATLTTLGRLVAAGNFRLTGRLYAFGNDGPDAIRVLHAVQGGAVVPVGLQAILEGGEGNDWLVAGGGADWVLGGGGNDYLTGGGNRDVIQGGTGSDRILEAGNVNFILTDSVLVGLGRDTLSGVEQATLTGGAGNNSFNVSGWTGTAVLAGQGGQDRIVSVNDADFVLTDTRLERSDGGSFTITGFELATLIGGAGDNTLNAFSFSGSVVLDGRAGNDILYGGAGGDLLLGGDGNDQLHGGRGLDTLYGQAGADYLEGGLDGVADVIFGGFDSDTFRTEWYSTPGGRRNRDLPRDFAAGERDWIVEAKRLDLVLIDDFEVAT